MMAEYVLMLTQQCNFRCTYCYQTHESIDQARSVVERLTDFLRQRDRPGETRLVFHGGEPLLRKDLLRFAVERLVDASGRRACQFGIVTNGSLIDAATFELFARHGFRVDVSFDGCREAQAFRDARSFERVVENLRALVREHAAGRIDLGVAITVTLENLPYLARSVEFLVELGIPRIAIEAELFGPWTEGAEAQVERQVEAVVRQMERRHARGLAVPVSRLAPRPEPLPWDVPERRETRRQQRLECAECSCGTGDGTASGSSLIDANGTVWACPMFAPGLGRVAPGRLAAPDAFRYGTWSARGGPAPAQVARQNERIRAEPIFAEKRGRHSIFAECASCEFAADCTACPASSHIPGAEKSPQEVPPLVCALNMAFLSRRDRLRRPATLLDAALDLAREREAAERSRVG